MSECQTIDVGILNIRSLVIAGYDPQSISLLFFPCHSRLFSVIARSPYSGDEAISFLSLSLRATTRNPFPYNSPLKAFFKTDFLSSSKSANFCL